MARRIRSATRQDARAIAAAHVASWRENYRGLLSEEAIAKRTFEYRLEMWTRFLDEPQRSTLIACGEKDEVIGFVSATAMRPPEFGFDAYLQTLYLLASEKGAGTGKALLRACATDLIARGCRNMALRTLRLNPARGFYEHLGARLLPPDFPLDAGHFDDVAYAFDNLQRLQDA